MPGQRDYQINTCQGLLWIAALALLAVGAKNFESGLTVDAPLYALLARGIVRTHDWFFLRGSVPAMQPFVEHPHLGLWLIAGVFKVLPAADWSARIVGHLFYFGFLSLFFVYLRRKTDEATAVGAVLLLWIWFRFANFFSNVYLDPGALFFGAAALFLFDWALAGKVRWAFAAGASLALCTMVKGLTVLGFLPGFAVLAWPHLRSPRLARAVGALLAGTCLVLGLYYLGIRASAVPDFLTLYWQKQWVHRFERQWDWWGVVKWSFWRPLLNDTYYLTLLAPFVFLKALQRKAAILPLVLVVFFIAMFAPAGRDGAHYRLMILPWIAWMVSGAVASNFAWNRAAVVRGTTIFCVVAVLVLQYIPNRTHGFSPPEEVNVLQRFQREHRISQLIFDMSPEPFDFTYNDFYSWYVDLPIQDVTDAVPAARADTAYLLFHSQPARESQVAAAGWCRYDRFGPNTLWLACLPHP